MLTITKQIDLCANNFNRADKSINQNIDTALSVQKSNITENPYRVLDRGYYPISFKGKSEHSFNAPTPKLKAEMQYAEAVINNMKNTYGYISPSKVMFTFNSKPTEQQQKWIKEKQKQLQDMRYNYPSVEDKTKFVDNLIKNISTKGSRIGNCYESAKLAEIALNANGVKNLSTVRLVGYTNPEFKSSMDMDHTFILVNGDLENENNAPWDKPTERYGKNAYVVDPWLGFVDTAENAMKIYSKVWENIPHYNQIQGYGMEEVYGSSLDLNAKDAKRTCEKYPELVVDKNVDLSRYEK